MLQALLLLLLLLLMDEVFVGVGRAGGGAGVARLGGVVVGTQYCGHHGEGRGHTGGVL